MFCSSVKVYKIDAYLSVTLAYQHILKWLPKVLYKYYIKTVGTKDVHRVWWKTIKMLPTIHIKKQHFSVPFWYILTFLDMWTLFEKQGKCLTDFEE